MYWHCADNHVSINTVSLSILRLYARKKCSLKIFHFIAKRISCAAGPEIVPKVKYFKNFSSDFKKQGLKLKLIATASYFEEKISIFFFQKIKIFTKNVFLVLRKNSWREPKTFLVFLHIIREWKEVQCSCWHGCLHKGNTYKSE